MSRERKQLPPAWVEAKLVDLVDRLQYGYTAKAIAERDSPKFLRITDIADGGIDWGAVPGCDIREADLAKYQLSDGDLVFARSGSIEKACRVSRPPEAVFASYLIRGKPLEDTLSLLLEQFVRSRAYLSQIGAFGAGIAMQNVNAKKLGSVRVPVPPLAEQRRIVAKIEELQARSRRAREALDAIPDLIEQFRQSVLAAAFRGDLTAEWREQQKREGKQIEPASDLLKRILAERRQRWEDTERDKLRAKGLTGDKLDKEFTKRRKTYKEPAPPDTTGVPDLPESWCWARWEQIGFCQNGRAFPSKHYSSEGMKLLRPGNLHASGAVEWTQQNTRRMPWEWASDYPSYIVGPNELVVNLTAQSLKDEFLGRACLTGPGEKCLLNQRIARLTPIGLLPKFGLWLLKCPVFRGYVDGLNTGSLIQHMFTSQIMDFALPLPPAEEQCAILRAIKGALEAKETTAAAVADCSHLCSALDQSILGKAFRGELVPQDPDDEPASVLLERIRQEREAG